ncbi:MAG: hypothetical protein A2X25_05505 [Chloroflexi bacterium GWB2_49_20]|nr:MAG: hypothetical protein A2X25_05505 [Chloroflexi bacterium GWB2_49_20]OGN77082.1 MAG: hypothetical protein A2X26_06505 [Chloroflexi bacterium GWC2_49_37]OGN83808.1 MAG: hypothetical protein A2X27_02105 [Chloroflexi bacterium GWD2_49_16]HCM96886.1 hypothetical protein [Anaerolineae bacterium]
MGGVSCFFIDYSAYPGFWEAHPLGTPFGREPPVGGTNPGKRGRDLRRHLPHAGHTSPKSLFGEVCVIGDPSKTVSETFPRSPFGDLRGDARGRSGGCESQETSNEQVRIFTIIRYLILYPLVFE